VRAPDYAEALIGWRVWCVVETRAGLLLASVIHDHVWPVGRETVAACLHGHAAPNADCACGIHAAREPAAVLSYLHGRDEPSTVARVLGRVRLWGRVVEHEGGWRAERAYPLDLVGGAYGRVADDYAFGLS
jgi:hypothetical protein